METKNLKKQLTTLMVCLLTTIVSFGQENNTVKYDDIINGSIEKGRYDTYVSKDGGVYNVGDRIEFGSPSGTNGKFVTITKIDITGGVYVVGREAINTSAEIKKIKLEGNSRRGYKVAFQTKGFTGIDNYFLYIEDAITTGEVKSSGMTSDEALTELKKAKDKMDLGLISKEEFEEIKTELSKYIK